MEPKDSINFGSEKQLHRSMLFIFRNLLEMFHTNLFQALLYRRSNVVEGLTSDFQRGLVGSCIENDYDNEGAKILKMLESAAEPELLMAEMSSEQLSLFSKYRAKIDVRSCSRALMRIQTLFIANMLS